MPCRACDRGELVQSQEDLKTKIQSLEAERQRLKNELDILRKAAEDQVAALEGEVAALHEERDELLEILGSDAKPVPAETVQVKSAAPANSAMPESSSIESSPPSPAPVAAKATLDSVVDTLSDDERTVINVLKAHGGRYPQRIIRIEAKLNWMQASRIINWLAEHGIVSIEKDGPIEIVVLAEELRK